MKYLILSALLCAGLWAQAQENLDVVTLKSGAIYKGVIAEYIPDDSLTIKLVDGRTKSFTADQIESVRSMEGEAKEADVEPKQSGYFHTSAIGFQLGRGPHSNHISFAYNMVNGYKYNNHNIGVGTGLETILQGLYVPAYLNYSYHLWDQKFSPYLGGEFGYVFNPSYMDGEYYGAYDYEGGYMAGLKFGVRNYLSENFGMIFSVGYRYYNFSGETVYWINSDGSSHSVDTDAHLHRFNLSVGILLN